MPGASLGVQTAVWGTGRVRHLLAYACGCGAAQRWLPWRSSCRCSLPFQRSRTSRPCSRSSTCSQSSCPRVPWQSLTAESTLTRLPCSLELRTSYQAAGSRSRSSASRRGSGRPTAVRCAPRLQRPPLSHRAHSDTRCTILTPYTCALSLAQLVYYIQPKSAHSTIHNHLLATGVFEGAMERWDAAHPTVLNDPMHEYGRSTAVSKELAELMEGGSPPLEWTVAREPLGHFIAGFDQIEFNCGREGLCGDFAQTMLFDNCSAWHKAFEASRPTHERAQAMLSDLVSQRGPPEYVESLIHIVPQSLGLVHIGGVSIERLSSVGAMEELDSAWADVQQLMGIATPTAIESHINPQGKRREGTQADIEQEMSLVRKRILRAVQMHAPWEAASAGAARRREALIASASSASDTVRSLSRPLSWTDSSAPRTRWDRRRASRPSNPYPCCHSPPTLTHPIASQSSALPPCIPTFTITLIRILRLDGRSSRMPLHSRSSAKPTVRDCARWRARQSKPSQRRPTAPTFHSFTRSIRGSLNSPG